MMMFIILFSGRSNKPNSGKEIRHIIAVIAMWLLQVELLPGNVIKHSGGQDVIAGQILLAAGANVAG